MKPTQEMLDYLKGLTASEILKLIALAKGGELKEVSANTVKDAEEALDWFIEKL